MNSLLVDSNVILDIFTADPVWFGWSSDQLSEAKDEVFINPIIYAEVSLHFASIEDLEAALPDFIQKVPLPWEAAFIAGRRFLEYKRRGGVRTAPLPDFYIGAHALIAGAKVLTRDDLFYRSYFPELRLISP